MKYYAFYTGKRGCYDVELCNAYTGNKVCEKTRYIDYTLAEIRTSIEKMFATTSGEHCDEVILRRVKQDGNQCQVY